MARIPMVTRTLKATKANCMCIDTEAEAIVKIDITVPRTFKDEKSLVKAIEKQSLVPANLKLVQVLTTETIGQKYGMTEADFMKYASPMGDADDADEAEQLSIHLVRGIG